MSRSKAVKRVGITDRRPVWQNLWNRKSTLNEEK